ncbi:type IV pilus assembly protein PilQ [Natronospira proteinivora]|uniref:Type IV pilus assembly protein PilQ n=1 Tax=Natronospira proteinivora TaxID=1807133 RepID=A0ABT1GDH8_9GAMM|nr:type IV pilus secretin PilQ [Natronospira proteinivora]MCP1728002.1 type IV pilus assembly protein PilQ [Natronospira proteinivora]
MGIQRKIAKHSLVALLGLALLVMFGQAAAQQSGSGQNRLEDVSVSTLPGDRVEIRLRLSEPAPEPQAFTIDEPARIVLDLANTRLGIRDRRHDIGVGAVRNLQLAEAQDRTRVVIGLSSSQGYDVHTEGNDIHIRVGDARGSDQLAAPDRPAAAPFELDEDAERPAEPSSIRDIDFRRGEQGEGRVLVELSDERTPIDIDESRERVVVTFQNADLARELERRLDVLDFATPVKTIDTRRSDDGVEMEIRTEGDYEQLAYQSENQFALEFRPLTEREVEERREQEYEGERLTLNFQDIETRAVLQLIADFTDLNIVVSDSVTGNVTLRLQNVPWDQALDIILQTQGLDTRQSGNVILVAPAQEIAQREQEELQARQAREELIPLRSEFIQVNYARAADLAGLIRSDSSQMLSDRGNVAVDDRTNTLLLQDTDERLEDVRRMVNRLDIPVRQVLIESRIVVATSDFNRELGARFGATHARERGDDGLMAVTGSAAGSDVMVRSGINNIQGGGGPLPVDTPNLDDRLNVNLPVTAPAGRFSMAILDSDYLVDLELSALQSQGRGEVISSPRVITADQKEAEISQGVEIPYQSAQAGTGAGAVTTEFKEAVLSLTVTPQITPDERIIMDLEVSNDTIGEEVPSATGGFVPSIDTRVVRTQAAVNNGETVVLGGIYETQRQEGESRVPLLGDIPGLGMLFRSTTRSASKAELLVFVTPKLLKDDARID